MSYQEKKTMVTMASQILILIVYLFYVFNQLQGTPFLANDLLFWARTILFFLIIGVVTTIVILIAFHIYLSIAIAFKENRAGNEVDGDQIEKTLELDMVEDEMDNLISLKAVRFGYAFSGFGFLAAVIAVVLGATPAVMINIIYLSFTFGSILEGMVQLYFYRRGVTNG